MKTEGQKVRHGGRGETGALSRLRKALGDEYDIQEGDQVTINKVDLKSVLDRLDRVSESLNILNEKYRTVVRTVVSTSK